MLTPDRTATVMRFEVENGEAIVIDRDRFLHKDTKAVAILQMKLQRAQRDLDAEAYEAAWDAIEALFAKLVVELPASWAARGIDVQQPGWMGEMSEPAFQNLMDTINPPAPGEKKTG
jgi:hypothetical protein